MAQIKTSDIREALNRLDRLDSLLTYRSVRDAIRTAPGSTNQELAFLEGLLDSARNAEMKKLYDRAIIAVQAEEDIKG